MSGRQFMVSDPLLITVDGYMTLYEQFVAGQYHFVCNRIRSGAYPITNFQLCQRRMVIISVRWETNDWELGEFFSQRNFRDGRVEDLLAFGTYLVSHQTWRQQCEPVIARGSFCSGQFLSGKAGGQYHPFLDTRRNDLNSVSVDHQRYGSRWNFLAIVQ